MSTLKKKVAVIGAGASGLTAIKCCLDEGLEPVCFERANYISGLWHYTDYVEEGQACVMKSTVINTSKEMMCYSDYPIPADYPIFMHNKYVDKYFHLYADEFGLKKYINMNTEVHSIKQSDDYKKSGKWEIVTSSKSAPEKKTHTFDFVLICTGHHADKNVPNFVGLDKFKGKVTHTHDYKDYHGYEDKNVLIIGIGNSGGDVATEISRISAQTYISTRSGAWIWNRISDGGNPVDMSISIRAPFAIAKKFPWLFAKITANKLNARFDHKKYSLQPEFNPMACHPTVNDELPNRIAAGSVKIKANVKEFTENGAIFEDGTEITDLDAVVLATGYIFGFPFLDKNVIDVKDNKVNLYQYMYPPDLDHKTLAVIGCFQPWGAIMPISEMQCRLATRVFMDKIKLPDSTTMWKDIEYKHVQNTQRYNESKRHTIQVDYITIMDELAEHIGCKPDLKTLLLTDPKLAMECLFGPCTPYQYRLQGPGKWKGARESILTQWERTYKPLQTRPCKVREEQSIGMLYVIVVALIAVIVYIIFL
ncbi:Cyclopentanone 1 [Mactra antiquata]